MIEEGSKAAVVASPRPAIETTARQLARRSLSNFAQTLRIIHRRFLTRKPHYPSYAWWTWSFVTAALVILAYLRLDLIAGSFQTQWPNWFLDLSGFLTYLGLGTWYFIASVAVLVWVNLTDWQGLNRRRLKAIYDSTCLASYVLVSLTSAGLTVTLLKFMFGRARARLFDQTGVLELRPFTFNADFASFPSGHSANMGVIFGVIAILWPRLALPAFAVTAILASTRVPIGAHYPSDVVAGFALGFAFSLASAVLFARLGFIFTARTVNSPQGLPRPKPSFSIRRVISNGR